MSNPYDRNVTIRLTDAHMRVLVAASFMDNPQQILENVQEEAIHELTQLHGRSPWPHEIRQRTDMKFKILCTSR